MGTVAGLKRDAKSGKYEARLIERWGEPIEQESFLGGWRKITDSNTVSIFLRNKDGTRSELWLPPAKLVEYGDGRLIIYIGGKRELNDDELRVMDEWEKGAYTGSKYYNKRKFFKSCGMEYLISCDEKIHGCRLTYATGKPLIEDDRIRGQACLKYEIREAQNGD